MSTPEEVSFLSGMEREPKDGYHDATVSIGHTLWSIDGIGHQALGMTRRVLEALGVVQAKALSIAERGPEDYAESSYERGMRDGAKLGGYHEAPKNPTEGNSSWQKWMMTLCGVLAATGIGGVVGMYGKLSAVEANQVSQQKQLDTLTQMLMNLTRRSP